MCYSTRFHKNWIDQIFLFRIVGGTHPLGAIQQKMFVYINSFCSFTCRILFIYVKGLFLFTKFLICFYFFNVDHSFLMESSHLIVCGIPYIQKYPNYLRLHQFTLIYINLYGFRAFYVVHIKFFMAEKCKTHSVFYYLNIAI